MKCDHVIFSQTEDTCSTFESGHIDRHQYLWSLKMWMFWHEQHHPRPRLQGYGCDWSRDPCSTRSHDSCVNQVVAWFIIKKFHAPIWCFDWNRSLEVKSPALVILSPQYSNFHPHFHLTAFISFASHRCLDWWEWYMIEYSPIPSMFWLISAWTKGMHHFRTTSSISNMQCSQKI